ncbi:amidase [Allopusillimonas soli]|uniref:Amidase n=1 Tax=Allopusillimonas soli TaxID=659016 RepID=A0A853FG29_9BURK|nr:amidase [Allopusillimonas soli]NYT38829.1 amidase [Allopusillimonas soli]TEA70195.1 amidase [Allopusillimonas soli]
MIRPSYPSQQRRTTEACSPELAKSGSEPVLNVFEKSITDLQASLAAGCFTSVDLVRAYLQRIEAYDQHGPCINAILRLDPSALEQAAAMDTERRNTGARSLLHGIPILVKDNFDVAGMPTSGGALALAVLEPEKDAFQVRRLREAGAIILGKTTMHELAAGITNVSSLTGVTRNPYSLRRNPGGSSGGTAAAVAVSFSAAGLGSDTSGSIRIPAANQNLVGLRPTFGLSSRDGILPLSPSQDVGGPLARTVRDLAIMLDATVGEDSNDSATSGVHSHIPDSYLDGLRQNTLSGARIGILSEFFGSRADEVEVSAIVREAALAMSELGAELIEVDLPNVAALMRESSLIAHEFKFALSDYLAAYEGLPAKSLSEILDRGLHHEQLDQVFRLRDQPESPDTTSYRHAREKKREISLLVQKVMDEHKLSAVLYPVLRGKPSVIGEVQPGENSQLSPSTGLPAISLPAGFTRDGVPVGLELLGRPYSEQTLLNFALDWELSGNRRVPPIYAPDLVNGKAPPPLSGMLRITPDNEPACAITVKYVLDPCTGRLGVSTETAQVEQTSIIALTLQSSQGERPGPVIFHLPHAAPGQASKEIVLQAHHLRAALKGELYVHLYTQESPWGAARVRFAPSGS